MAVVTGFNDWIGVINAYATGQIDGQAAGDTLDQMVGPNWPDNPTISDTMRRATAARAGRFAPATPAAPTSAPLPVIPPGTPTEADILADYRAGRYGAVGSAAARDQAIVNISKIYTAQGRQQNDAFTLATERFNQSYPWTVPDVATTARTRPYGPGLNPNESIFPNDELAYQQRESETPQGRRNLFARYLAQALPENTPAPVQTMYERLREPYQNAFALQRGLGQIAADQTFTDFLRGQAGSMGLTRPAPGYLPGLVEQTRQLLGQPPATGENPQRSAFREELLDEQRGLPMQKEFALGAVAPSVSPELRQALGQLDDRAFNTFMLGRNLGNTGFGNYLDFTRGGNIAAQSNPEAYRQLAQQSANLFNASPGVLSSLSPTEQAFRGQLEANPEQQFHIALNAVMPTVPEELRNSFARQAAVRYRQFQNQQGSFGNFLPFVANQGFQFFR